MDYFKKELLHTSIGVGLSVLVALAGEAAGWADFSDVSLSGMVITAARTAGTAIVTLVGPVALRFMRRE